MPVISPSNKQPIIFKTSFDQKPCVLKVKLYILPCIILPVDQGLLFLILTWFLWPSFPLKIFILIVKSLFRGFSHQSCDYWEDHKEIRWIAWVGFRKCYELPWQRLYLTWLWKLTFFSNLIVGSRVYWLFSWPCNSLFALIQRTIRIAFQLIGRMHGQDAGLDLVQAWNDIFVYYGFEKFYYCLTKISTRSALNFHAYIICLLSAITNRKGFSKSGPWYYFTMLLIFFVFNCKNQLKIVNDVVLR